MSIPKRLSFFILALLFIISIGVRIPNLNRPLSEHQEWAMATSLRTIQIWTKEGALKHKFIRVMSYPGQANKFINNQGRILDKKGNSYYISYPPFAYILPYFVFKLLHIPPKLLQLQIFNLGLHLLNCCLMYLLVLTLFPQKKEEASQWNPLASLGFIVYLFTPITLWYHSNVYNVDELAQTLLLLILLVLLSLLKLKEINKRNIFLLGFVNFLFVYTDWFGLIFAFTVGIYMLIRYRNEPRFAWPIILTLGFSSLFALLLTVWQYAQIAGLTTYLTSLQGKFAERSGYVASAGHDYNKIFSLNAWYRIRNHYWFSYGIYRILD